MTIRDLVEQFMNMEIDDYLIRIAGWILPTSLLSLVAYLGKKRRRK